MGTKKDIAMDLDGIRMDGIKEYDIKECDTGYVSFEVGNKGKMITLNKDWVFDFKDNKTLMSYLLEVVIPWYNRKKRRIEKRHKRKDAIKRFKTRLKNIMGRRTPDQRTKDTISEFYSWWEKEVEKGSRFN